MGVAQDQTLQFTVKGRRYELSRSVVEGRLTDAVPEPIYKHAVKINGRWFPVTQAFEAALNVPRMHFISDTARRHFAALGFEMRGERTSRIAPVADSPDKTALTARPVTDEWFREANVQAAVVTALASAGWRILSVANTATRERGVDVIAQRGGRTVGAEVKGFPSGGDPDPVRAGENKPTAPSTQAGHCYAQAVLAAMRLRSRRPGWRSVIVLPDFPHYRGLFTDTAGSLAAASIDVRWLQRDGRLHQR